MPGISDLTPEQRKIALEKSKASRKARAGVKARLSPLQAIRAKCLDCCVGSAHEVGECVCPDCSLFEYRFGRRPTAAEVEVVKGIKVLGRDKELWQPLRKIQSWKKEPVPV